MTSMLPTPHTDCAFFVLLFRITYERFYLATHRIASQLLMSFVFNDCIHYNMRAAFFLSLLFLCIRKIQCAGKYERKTTSHTNLNGQCIGTNCGECVVVCRHSMASQWCWSGKNAFATCHVIESAYLYRKSECTVWPHCEVVCVFIHIVPHTVHRCMTYVYSWCYPAAIAL